MAKEGRTSELMGVFANIDETERKLIVPLIHEAEFLEKRLTELRSLPFIEHHPNNPDRVRTTAAAKQYKEHIAAYSNIIRILLNTLRKTETDEQNELLRRLEDFTL